MSGATPRGSGPLRRAFIAWAALLLGAAGIFFLLRQSPGGEDPVAVTPPTPPVRAPGRNPAVEAAEGEGDGSRIAPQTSPSSRTAVRPPALRCRVASRSTSRPIAGAQATWTALVDELASWESAPSAVEHHTRTAPSDASGSVVFEAPPPGAASRDTVLWITHEDYRSARIRIAGEADVGDVLLEAAPRRHAVVVDGRGRPVEGALVELWALPPPDATAAETSLLRALRRSVRTGDDGRARLPHLSSRESAVARSKANVSAVWTGAGNEDVRLILHETFQAHGRVLSYAPEGTPSQTVRVTLAMAQGEVAAKQEPSTALLAEAAVGRDGTWGPIRVPRFSDASYRFRLEGDEIVPEEVFLDEPAAGRDVTVDFEGLRGETVWILATDPRDAPLPAAEAVVRWRVGGHWVSKRATARADGVIVLPHCRPGEVVATVRCEGYVPETLPPIRIPQRETRTWGVRLTPAGTLRVRCESEGRPLERFEIVSWRLSDPYAASRRQARAEPDGYAVLREMPQGELALQAFVPGLGFSEIVHTRVEAGRKGDLDIELSPSVSGFGRVVNRLNGEPVPTARVQAFAATEPTPVQPLTDPVTVDAEGRFDLPLPPTSGFLLVADAPGYSRVALNLAARGVGAPFDLGRIALVPLQPLEIQLVSAGAVDFSRLTISAESSGIPPTPVPSSGFLHFPAVPAGKLTLLLRDPDGMIRYFTANLEPGEEWALEVPVDGEQHLVVQVRTADGSPLPAGAIVAFVWHHPIYGRLDVEKDLPPNGRAEAHGVFEDLEVTAAVFDADRSQIGRAVVRFGGADERELEIVVGDRWHVRVVDRGGDPVHGASVLLRTAGRADRVSRATTNAEGMATFGAVPEGPLLAWLSHPTLGTCIDQEVAPSRTPGAAPTLVLDATSTVRVLLVDRRGPVPGVRCELHDTATGNAGLELAPRVSDEEGRITWERLGPGTYDVWGEHPDYFPFSAAVPTDTAEPFVKELRRVGRLSIAVRDPQGRPLAGVPVRLWSEEKASRVAEWVAGGWAQATPPNLVTDSSGRLLVEGLPNGPFRWSVETSQGTSASGTVDVPPLDTAQLDITVP